MSKNSDNAGYFAELVSGREEREVTYNGKNMAVWVRRITAGERMNLNSGSKYKMKPGPDGKMSGEVDVDLADQMRRQYQLIYYAIVREDGTRIFKNPEAVREVEAGIVDQLFKIADEFNKEDTNDVPGKSSTASASASSSV